MSVETKPALITRIETPAQLSAVGRSIFGADWKREISKRLDVNMRSVQRWVSGEYRIPEDLGESIGRLALDRAKELGEISDALCGEETEILPLKESHDALLNLCDALIRMQGRTSVVIPRQIFEDQSPGKITIDIENSPLDGGYRLHTRR